MEPFLLALLSGLGSLPLSLLPPADLNKHFHPLTHSLAFCFSPSSLFLTNTAFYAMLDSFYPPLFSTPLPTLVICEHQLLLRKHPELIRTSYYFFEDPNTWPSQLSRQPIPVVLTVVASSFRGEEDSNSYGLVLLSSTCSPTFIFTSSSKTQVTSWLLLIPLSRQILQSSLCFFSLGRISSSSLSGPADTV